ncbi:MAG: hypothetical protein WCO84_06455 [bacterium]
MKSLVVIAYTLLVVGCTTVPVVQKFPSAPATLIKPAPPLKEIPAGSSASQIFDIVIDNYGTYNEVAAELAGWQQWYVEQKKIFDGVK